MSKDNSELVSWSPTFSVGIGLVDEQHKGLLNLVNDMYNHVTSDENAEREYFQKIINQAVNYVKVHFATEEKIMKATKFPGYVNHKKAHDTFVLDVVDFIKEFDTGKKFSLIAFTRFLKEWILTHIAIMDKQYFNFFKQIARRNVNGKMSISLSSAAAS